MTVARRGFLALAGTAVIAPLGIPWTRVTATENASTMYGLIGKMTAVAGQRDAVASILLDSTQSMPGCLSYVIATDPADADALWITEVWDSAASHKASLALPAVQAAIAKARSLIAGFSNRVETVPIGGSGLNKTEPRTPAPAALTEIERQRLVAHLEMTAAWLADEVTGLTPAQIDFQRQPNAWTIAQVVEHLVVVAPIYWKDLQSALQQPAGDRTSAMTDADILWYGIDRTRREQAIPTERPTGQLRDLRAALEAYRKYHDRLLQYIKTTRDDLRSHIVQRQSCDAYQWALLISTHEQRHILQIREIKADPKFPKK